MIRPFIFIPVCIIKNGTRNDAALFRIPFTVVQFKIADAHENCSGVILLFGFSDQQIATPAFNH